MAGKGGQLLKKGQEKHNDPDPIFQSEPGVMSRREMVETLTLISRTSITDILEVSDDDKTLVDADTGKAYRQSVWRLKRADEVDDVRRYMAISEITATNGNFKVKLHDQKVAMAQLSKLMGYDKPEVIEIKKSEKTIEDFYD